MTMMAAPAAYASSVTPSDSANLGTKTRALWIGGTGNVSVQMNDATIIFTNVPVGILPICCSRVNFTGTTASGILALW